MSQFKTHEEIFRALIDGKKVRYNGWDERSYVHLKNGTEVDEWGKEICCSFAHPTMWSIYNEPKPKKILKPFLFVQKEDVGCFVRFHKDEDEAKKWIFDESKIKYLGPAKGIPDQEVDSD